MGYTNGYSVEVTKAWHDMEIQGKESHGKAWKGMEMQGMAWHVKERHGKAWHGMTR
jgi:hypothetical protein